VSFRITQDTILRTVLNGIHTSSERVGRLYEQFATQKRINLPSDDPAGTGVVMRLEAKLCALEQGEASIRSAETFMDHALGALSNIEELVADVRTIGVRAVSGQLGPGDREGLALQIDQLLEGIVEGGNSELGDRYVFSGTATDQPALTVTRNADGEIATVSYGGAEQQLEFPIHSGRKAVVSVRADEAFVDSDLFRSIISLRDHLRNEAGLSDEELSEALADDQAELKAAHQTLLNQVGKVGWRRNQIDLTREQIASSVIRAREMLAEHQQPDVASIALALERENAVYQAMLGASARIIDQNLMDYIR